MIGSIGNSYTAVAAQTAAKRSSGIAFGNIMAGVADTLPKGSMPPSYPASQASLPSETTASQPVDFTHMTRAELRSVINSKIKSGGMSIDDSEGFVLMMGPSEAELAGKVDDTKIDFMQSVRGEMEFTKQHGNTAWLGSLEKALGTMQRYQGQGQANSVSRLA